MREYMPDFWLIVEIWNEISPSEEHFFKVFATWGGSFTTGDSWKLSSGISKVQRDGKTIIFNNESGSIYKVHESAYRTTLYSQSVIQSLTEQFKNRTDGIRMKILTEDEAHEFVNKLSSSSL